MVKVGTLGMVAMAFQMGQIAGISTTNTALEETAIGLSALHYP